MASEVSMIGDGTRLWEVTDVQDAFGPAMVGQNNRYKRVYFKVIGMDPTYVDVPLTADWVAVASRLIEEHAQQLMDARMLKGPIVGP